MITESEEEAREIQMKKNELKTLKRSVRTLAADRRAYTDDAKFILKRQEEEISKLQDDNKTFGNLIGYMNSTLIKARDSKSRKKLQTLAKDIDKGKNNIRNETETLRQINFQISRKDDAKHVQLRLNSKKNKPTIKVLLRRIRSLENRLETQQCSFNTQLTRNQDLREQIDHLRHGRALYSKLYSNLSNDLADIKQERRTMTRAATEAYTCGNDAKVKIRAITERSQKEKDQHMNDMKGLQRIIEHHDKMAEFMDIKSYDRSKMVADVMMKRRKMISDRNYCQEQKAIMKYEDAFGLIKEVAETDDMKKIIKDFTEREDQNYAMFNYINELNESIDAAKLELTAKEAERDKYDEQNGIEDAFRRKVARELEEKNTKLQDQLQEYSLKYGEMRKKLDDLKKPIRNLFDSIGCDPSPMTGMLGYDEEITDQNLMQYLGIIEDRAMETLNTHYFATETVKERYEKDPTIKMVKIQGIASPPCIECVPPNIVDSDFLAPEKMTETPINKLRLMALVRNKLDIWTKKKHRKFRKKSTAGSLRPRSSSRTGSMSPGGSDVDESFLMTDGRTSVAASDDISEFARTFETKTLDGPSVDKPIEEEQDRSSPRDESPQPEDQDPQSPAESKQLEIPGEDGEDDPVEDLPPAEST